MKTNTWAYLIWAGFATAAFSVPLLVFEGAFLGASRTVVADQEQTIRDLRMTLAVYRAEAYRSPTLWQDSVNPNLKWSETGEVYIESDSNSLVIQDPLMVQRPVCTRCGKPCNPDVEYWKDGKPTICLCGSCMYEIAELLLRLYPAYPAEEEETKP